MKGVRGNETGDRHSHVKKSLLLCVRVHCKCLERSASAASNDLWSGKSADAADVSGIPCSGEMRWRVGWTEGTSSGQRQDGRYQARDHRGLGCVDVKSSRQTALTNSGRMLGVPSVMRRAGNNGLVGVVEPDDAGLLEHGRRGRSSGIATEMRDEFAVNNLAASRRVDIRKDCALLTQCTPPLRHSWREPLRHYTPPRTREVNLHCRFEDGALVAAECSDGHDIRRSTKARSRLTRCRAPVARPCPSVLES